MTAILAAIKAKSLTYALVAKEVGVHPSLVGQIVRQEHSANPRVARKLEHLLGIPREDFFKEVVATQYVLD